MPRSVLLFSVCFLSSGAALESALVFWSLAARVNSGDWNFQFLLKTLLAPLRCANASPNRDAYPNLAKCMAEVMRPDPTDQNLYREKCRLVDQMIADLRAAETTNNFRYLYMLCLGEVSPPLFVRLLIFAKTGGLRGARNSFDMCSTKTACLLRYARHRPQLAPERLWKARDVIRLYSARP